MSTILLLLIKFKYLILLPIIIIEGPFATVISGFLIATGVFNVFIAYPIIILGDVISDSIFYFVGRLSHNSITKWILYFGVTSENLENAKKYFNKKSTRAIVASKFIHGIGVSGLMVSGMLKIPFLKYLRVCLITDILQFGVLLAIGYFFGQAYARIGIYLNDYAKIMSVLAVVAVLLILVKVFYNRSKKSKANGAEKTN